LKEPGIPVASTYKTTLHAVIIKQVSTVNPVEVNWKLNEKQHACLELSRTQKQVEGVDISK